MSSERQIFIAHFHSIVTALRWTWWRALLPCLVVDSRRATKFSFCYVDVKWKMRRGKKCSLYRCAVLCCRCDRDLLKFKFNSSSGLVRFVWVSGIFVHSPQKPLSPLRIAPECCHVQMKKKSLRNCRVSSLTLNSSVVFRTLALLCCHRIAMNMNKTRAENAQQPRQPMNKFFRYSN